MMYVSGEFLVCESCGLRVPYKGKLYRHSCNVSKAGLGTRLERILKTVGITEERWRHLWESMGYPPTCGCQPRKYFLNRIKKRLAIGYIKGGIKGAWREAKLLADETREHFAKPR